MSGVSINAGELTVEISKALSEYTEEVSKAIEEEIDKTADDIVKDIKSSSAWTDRTKGYRKGWAVKKEKSQGVVTRIVYNKNKPQLTHLLEFGHVNRDGTRTAGRAHIGPAWDKYEKQLNKRIEEIIQNGG